MANIGPRRPGNLDPLGVEILEELRKDPNADRIILGGNTALQHYLEFRPSHDIDAWWSDVPTNDAKHAIHVAINTVAVRHGYRFRERAWGDTLSYEIQAPAREETIFSFQIAIRDVHLDPPVESSWPPIKIETFRDNLGAKMNALVDRGAPRDFVDIYEVVKANLATTQDCWLLWQQKNPKGNVQEARRKALHNLMQLEARMPTATIPPPQRAVATERREFFRSTFLRERENEAEHGR